MNLELSECKEEKIGDFVDFRLNQSFNRVLRLFIVYVYFKALLSSVALFSAHAQSQFSLLFSTFRGFHEVLSMSFILEK